YPMRAETMSRAVDRALVQERLMGSLAAAFGVLALALAGIGLHGLMSYSVTRRAREIGIRMAIEARPEAVARMVVRESLALIAAGLARGAPAVSAGSRLVRAMLYAVRPLDGFALAFAAVTLLAMALAAAYMPARRASRVDPSTALRCD